MVMSALAEVSRPNRADDRRQGAARDLQEFQERYGIKASDITEHHYAGEFYDVFYRFTNGKCLQQERVEAWLDPGSMCNTSSMSYKPDFVSAVRKEYGAWPFAAGVDSWSKSATISFSEFLNLQLKEY